MKDICSKLCEICKNKASNICYQCFTYFCDTCYTYVHEKEANHNHKNEKIDPFLPIDIRCPEHPKNAINLFCVDEKGNSLIK